MAEITRNHDNDDYLSHEFKRSIEWHLDRGHRLIRLHKWTVAGKDCKAPFDKNWRTQPGLTKRQAFSAVRAGHNLGWAPEGEHLIIDVDMHGSKNGLATYDKFRQLLPPEHTIPRVNSSRGGFHLYLRKPRDEQITRRKLKEKYGDGVDVVANQQVVIPASIHPKTNRPYEFVNMPDEIPEWTDEIRELLIREEIDDRRTSTSIEDLPDIRAVERLVMSIPNANDENDYEDWFALGCAIHESTAGSDDGLEIYHSWSAQNSLYDEDYTDKKWESMGRYDGKRAGFGTIVERAREYQPQLVSDVLHAVNTPTAAADFADLPPPQKDFNIDDKTQYAWHLVEEELDYSLIAPDEWYYRDVLPKGAYSVMAGRQGLGKSTLIMHLAACVTNGKPFPGDEDNPLTRKPGDVIYFSVEERVRQSILPKLKQSGADLKRFHAFRAGVTRVNRKGEEEVRGFSVNKGIHHLEEQLRRYPDTRLVIFDPITMFIIHENSADSNNAVSMNQSLAPLNKLAEDHDLCILGVTHFNKSGGRGLDKVTGSIAHTTVARHVTYLLPHYLDHHTVIATAKSNMFTDKTSYVFHGVELDPEFIEGFESPLRKRELYLYERNDEGLDADEWERLVEDRLDGDVAKKTAQDHLASQIIDHITEHSLQKHYWEVSVFKDHFKQLFPHHDNVYSATMTMMVNDKRLHRENVRGTWYVWPLDGLIADNEEELEEFNDMMRDTIRNSRAPQSASEQLYRDVKRYVFDQYPNAVSYEELRELFSDFGDTKKRAKAIKQLEDEGCVERLLIKQQYGYLIAVDDGILS